MPQRYKLRLGDGTVLAVDSEGLNTWVHDRRAMAQAVGTQQWRPLQAVMAEEAAAARLAKALVPPKPRQATPQPAAPEPAPPPQPAFEPPPFEPAPFEPPPFQPAPFEQPADSVFDPGSLLSPPEEPATPAFELPDLPPPSAAPAPDSRSGSSFTGSDFGAEPTAPAAPQPEEFEPAPPRSLPASYDEEPVSSRYFEAASEPAEDENLPVIPMKPLEEPDGRFHSAWSEAGSSAEDDADDWEDDRRGAFDDESPGVLERFGGFLSRILGPLAPLADRLTASRRWSPDDDERDARRESEAKDDADDEPRPSLAARLSGWARGLRERFRREEREDEPGADAPDTDEFTPAARQEPSYGFGYTRASDPPPPAPKPTPVVPEPVVPLAKPAAELPVIPFKAAREPRERSVVYDDEDSGFWSGFSSDVLAPAWLWLKRIVTTAALVGAAAYAWTERREWLPGAADLGQSLFAQIDRLVLSRSRHEERERALAEVSARLPQLDAHTIGLVFARNPRGVEEAGEVFQVTREAAARGAASLPQEEAAELRSLEAELMARLSRTEQARVAEYDGIRERRPVFPFENPHVMELVARAARELPPDRLARLQSLLHKAVAAGLAAPAPPAGAPAR